MNIETITWKVDFSRINRLTEFTDGELRESFKQVLLDTVDLPYEHYVIYNRSRDREVSGYLSLLMIDECVVAFFRPEGEIRSLEHIEDKINAEKVYIPTNTPTLISALANKYRDVKRKNSNRPDLANFLPDSLRLFYGFDGNLIEKRLFHNSIIEKFKTYTYFFKKDHLKRVSEISQWLLLIPAGFVQGVIIPNLMDYLGGYGSAGLASLFLLALRPIINVFTNPSAAEKVDKIPKEQYVLQHFWAVAKKIALLYSLASFVILLDQRPMLDMLPKIWRVPFGIMGLAIFLMLDTWAYMNVMQQHFGMIRHVLSETPRFKQHSGKYVQDNAISQSLGMLCYTLFYFVGYSVRWLPYTVLLPITIFFAIPFGLSKLSIILRKPRFAIELEKHSDLIYYLTDKDTENERYLYSFDTAIVDAIEDTRPYVTVKDNKYMVWINGDFAISIKSGKIVNIEDYQRKIPIPFAKQGEQKIICTDGVIVLYCYRRKMPLLEKIDDNSVVFHKK